MFGWLGGGEMTPSKIASRIRRIPPTTRELRFNRENSGKMRTGTSLEGRKMLSRGIALDQGRRLGTAWP